MSKVAAEAAKVDVKSMTKTERIELRRIVRRRFKMLREQLQRRERELYHALQKQAEEDRAARIKKIEAKLKPLIKRQNELAKAYEKLYDEAEELDIAITGRTPVTTGSGTKYGAIAAVVRPAVSSREAYKQIKEIKEAAGWQRLDLDELEWKLDEQLAIGELESGSSKEFLEALPTVESMLPLPKGITLPEIVS